MSMAPLVNSVTIQNTIDQSPAAYILTAGPLPTVKLSTGTPAEMNLLTEISAIPGLATKISNAFVQRAIGGGNRFPSFQALATFTGPAPDNVPYFNAAEQAVIIGFSSNSQITMY